MSANTYLSTVQMGVQEYAIGTTLFGTTNTFSTMTPKEISMPAFDGPEEGISIWVRFHNSSKMESGASLKINNLPPVPVYGPCVCNSEEILNFIYEIREGIPYWHVVGSAAGTNSGGSTIAPENAVTSVDYDTSTRELTYTLGEDNVNHILTFGTMAFALQENYIAKSMFTHQYDMLYAEEAGVMARLPANTSPTKKYLRTMGIESTTEVDGETVVTVTPTAPEWDEITKSDIGLSNVTNHKQVTEVEYDSATGAFTVTKGDDLSVTLFNLGSNAFNSTSYLPIAGGTLLGLLTFNEDSDYLTWQHETKSQRLLVSENSAPESVVFTFQQEGAEGWETLLTLRADKTVVANAFQGSLKGNADTASNLKHATLTSVTLDDATGTLAFSGIGAPWTEQNWTGFQVGDSNLKFQIIDADKMLQARLYNGETWTAWSPIVTVSSITTGDNNGQIKFGETNINVRGLGALAFIDTLDENTMPDISNMYVTIDTDQEITGVKTFNNIEFFAPEDIDAHGIKFNGDGAFAHLRYFETADNNILRLSTQNVLLEMAQWENDTETKAFSFSKDEWISYSNIFAFHPDINGDGALGTDMYKWGTIHAVDIYGELTGNASTATNALNDTNGLQIDTNYLKLSGGTMTGKITTTSPINQIIENGTFVYPNDNGATASPNRYSPVKWIFDLGNVPAQGDIITIRTPAEGHEYGVYLSTDNGSTFYPITLTGEEPVIDQYPAGSCLTLIFDAVNAATGIYAANGSDARTRISGGTWRVLNYYDSGAPYGVRVYKQTADLNHEFPILVSSYQYNDISAPFMNNVYAVLNSDSSKVPTINPATGVITAAGFAGPMEGIATEAIEFSVPATVTLTGMVTGVSTPSKRDWIVDTTIEDETITNEMLIGGIGRDKLETGVVKVFTKEEISTLNNIDNIPINGFFPVRASTEMPIMSGYRPFATEHMLINLSSPDDRAKFQLASDGEYWLTRVSVGNNASMANADWRNIVIENGVGGANPTWNISISGMSDSAAKDANGNVITTYYATNERVDELLNAADALVFKGILDNTATYDDDGRRVYRNLPTAGYQAGWTYKVVGEGIYAGQKCELGDLVIAVNDGPISGNMVISDDWTVVQANLENAITTTGVQVTEKSFAIFDSTSGKVVRDTGEFMVSLDHIEALAGVSKVGHWDGFRISGMTYENPTELVSGTESKLVFGDAGPQIQFLDNTTLSAILYDGHVSDTGLSATFNFVTDGGQAAIKADGFVARERMAIGSELVDYNSNLSVKGVTTLLGKFVFKDITETNSIELEFANGMCNFNTLSQFKFNNTMHVGGSIIPTDNLQTLGLGDPVEPKTWHAVYIGSKLSYGSNYQSIYWNEGIPTPLTYETNRLYYAPSDDTIDGVRIDPGMVYMPGNHYISKTKLAINYIESEPPETFYVNGSVRIDGPLAQRGDILPADDGKSDLGSTTSHWAHIYVGDKDSYGDLYTPIYWNNGAPANCNFIQKTSFAFTGTTTTLNINKVAYSTNTVVIQIAITSGKENLTAPIAWAAGNNVITLSMETPPRGPVEGYIITARGTEI